MKTSKYILLFFTMFLSLTLVRADLPQTSDNISVAIRTANSRQLAGYFGNMVELVIPGKEGTYSKAQAEMLMKDFFSNHPPSSFMINQKGSSAGGSQFMIGTYKSGKNTYKTYILLKQANNQMAIQQVQFEED